MTNIPDRKKYLNKGTRLVYTLERGREEGTDKAVEVRILPKGGEGEATSSIDQVVIIMMFGHRVVFQTDPRLGQ